MKTIFAFFLSKKRNFKDILSKRTSEKSIPLYLLFFVSLLIIFASNNPIDRVSLFSLIIAFIASLFIFVFYVLPLNKNTIIKIYLRNIGLWFVLFFSFWLGLVFLFTKNYNSIFGFMRIVLCFWCGFLISECFSFGDFISAFRKVFMIICAISVFFYLIVKTTGYEFSSVTYNGAYYNYAFFYFSIISKGTGVRNCGVFWEPGIYASFCLFFMLIEILFVKTPVKKKIIPLLIYFTTILSTGALAGYLLIVILIPPLLMTISQSKKAFVASTIIIVFIILFLMILMVFTNQIVKAFPVFLEKGKSFTTRYYSFFVDLEVYKTSPVFGVGSNYSNVFWTIARQKYPGLIDTPLNTFGYLIGFSGLGGVVFLLLFIISTVFNSKTNFIGKSSIIVLGTLVLCKEPHYLSLITIILFFYLVKSSSININRNILKSLPQPTLFLNWRKKNER